MMVQTKKQSIILCILICSIIVLRLPVLHFWNDKNTGDDASLYIETAIHLAKGEGYYASMLRHIHNKELLIKYVKKNGVKDRMEWIPPLYICSLSLLYLIAGSVNFYLFINIFNILLFVAFLFLFLQFVRKIFPNEFYVLFISVFIIGFNFVIFEFTFGAHIESFYILTFFIAFLIHIKLIKKTKAGFLNYLLYSIALSIFVLSKYSAIPFAAAFIFHHLFRKDYKSFFSTSILTFLFVAPWMIVRSYIISGHPLAQIIRGDFPFSETIKWSGFGSYEFYSIYSYLKEITNVFSSYLSLDLFFIFIPFVLFILLQKNIRSNCIKETILILFIFSFCFFALIINSYLARYQILLLIPMIPFAVQELLIWLRNKKPFINIKIFFVISLVLFGCIQFFKITEFYNFVRKNGLVRSEIITQSLDLVKKSGIGSTKKILVNVLGFNVFSSNTIVLTPKNINSHNKYELFSIYDIDYVLFAEGERNLADNIYIDLELVRKSDKKSIFLYKISKSNTHGFVNQKGSASN